MNSLRQKFVHIYLILIIPLVLNAQTGQHSLLWKVSGNGLSQPSYIYGTIHMIEGIDFKVRPEIDSVFALSQILAEELKMDDPSVMQKTQEWIPLPAGKTLQDYCTPEEYNKIKKYVADSMGIDISLLNNMKPFVLLSMLSASGLDDSKSYDMYFLDKATDTGKPVVGLETIEAQLHPLDTVPFDVQLDWVVLEIDSADAASDYSSRLKNAYLHEDLDELSKIGIDESPELKNYIDPFLYNRNRNWIPVIENLIRAQSVFIAVGAGHLAGEKGILQLLRDKGYSVDPL